MNAAKLFNRRHSRVAAAVMSAMLLIYSPTSTFAGSTNGPSAHSDTVESRRTDVYTVVFRAREMARVAVKGDGDTDLDLYIYDANGILVAKDDDYTDTCLVSWEPRWTGRFTIKVVNRGAVYNEYVIATN